MARSVLTGSVLAIGAEGAGFDIQDALFWRLQTGRYSSGYDPTGTHDYRYVRNLADGSQFLLDLAAAGTPRVDNGSLYRHFLKASDAVLLVYRIDQRSTLTELESIYREWIPLTLPFTRTVFVVAACSDLVSVCGPDNIEQGLRFANEHGLDFFSVSAKTGEGCDDLEKTITTAISKARTMRSSAPTKVMARRVEVGILAIGAQGAGIDALLGRLACGYFVDSFDPTHSPDYQKVRKLTDGTIVRLNMLAGGALGAEFRALWQDNFVHYHDIILLVYRVDQPASLTELESMWQQWVLPRVPSTLAVYVVATCSDLAGVKRGPRSPVRSVQRLLTRLLCSPKAPRMPAQPTCELETIVQGKKFASEHGLDFVAVSAKNGAGFDDLETAMIKAAVKNRMTDSG